MSDPIDVYFEFPSPYSYLAAQQLPAIAARHGRPLRWRPVDIAGIWSNLGVLEAYGAVRKVKVGYIMRDAARVARAAGVPLAPFRRLPDVRLARLATHRLNLEAPDATEPFVLTVWRKLFVEQADIGDPDVLRACAPPSCADLVGEAGGDAGALAALVDANAAALTSGCFGVPWIVVDGEAYFGQDRLDLVEAGLSRGGDA